MDRPLPLDALEHRIADLDARIEPLIRRIESPHLPVLDRGGFRAEAEGLLDDILAAFVAGTPQDRDAIRTLFRRFGHFAWGIAWAQRVTAPKEAPLSAALCRTKLAFFAIQDQGRDPRDAILSLQGLCAASVRSGLPVADLLTEAAALASDDVRYAAVGASSTRALLLATAERYRG